MRKGKNDKLFVANLAFCCAVPNWKQILISNHLSYKILENLDNYLRFGVRLIDQIRPSFSPDRPTSFTSWTFSSVIRIWILYLVQGLCAKSVQWSNGQLDKAVFLNHDHRVGFCSNDGQGENQQGGVDVRGSTSRSGASVIRACWAIVIRACGTIVSRTCSGRGHKIRLYALS